MMNRKRTNAFTLIELMIVVAIIAIILSIAIPSIQNARKSANEVSAIGLLRAASTVSEQYRTRFGRYPSSELDLFATGYLPSGVGGRGFDYVYLGAPTTWSLTATPRVPGESADRSFFVDHSGVIRFSSTEIATAASPAFE